MHLNFSLIWVLEFWKKNIFDFNLLSQHEWAAVVIAHYLFNFCSFKILFCILPLHISYIVLSHHEWIVVTMRSMFCLCVVCFLFLHAVGHGSLSPPGGGLRLQGAGWVKLYLFYFLNKNMTSSLKKRWRHCNLATNQIHLIMRDRNNLMTNQIHLIVTTVPS